MMGSVDMVLAQDHSRRENIIKTSFVLKFIAFVEWPQYSETINLCILGNDPYPEFWQVAHDEGFIEQNVNIRNLRSLDSIQSCQVVFIRNHNTQLALKALAASKNYPSLLIGESPELSNSGIGINFLIRKNKVRFEINQKAIEKRGLKISSELLALGIPVSVP